MREDLPLTVTHEVRDSCLCLHLQRAARAVGRRFDEPTLIRAASAFEVATDWTTR